MTLRLGGRTRRRGVPPRATSTAAALLAVAALAACGDSDGGATDDARKLEEALKGNGFKELTQGTYTVADADCPDGLDLQEPEGEQMCVLDLAQVGGEAEKGAPNTASVQIKNANDRTADVTVVESDDVTLEDGSYKLNLEDGSGSGFSR